MTIGPAHTVEPVGIGTSVLINGHRYTRVRETPGTVWRSDAPDSHQGMMLSWHQIAPPGAEVEVLNLSVVTECCPHCAMDCEDRPNRIVGYHVSEDGKAWWLQGSCQGCAQRKETARWLRDSSKILVSAERAQDYRELADIIEGCQQLTSE